jgi:hypothetical protein
MRLRHLQFVLLASFAFWATGAARFLHERIEHGGVPVASTNASAQNVTFLSYVVCGSDAPAHMHDDCSVCDGLASMVAGSPAPCFSVGSGERLIGIIRSFDPQITLAQFIQFPLSRGPPSASPISKA